jgi:PTH1 family peptidyl-tRNA hydrolase
VWLIVGLGNPGHQYTRTRHNYGLWVMDAAATALKAKRLKDGFESRLAAAELRGEKILFCAPQTFMNLSGRAVAPLARFYKIPPEQMLVCHDELDLPVGELRFKKAGGTAGHNGLESIVSESGEAGFWRLRLGIGSDLPKNSVSSFVLSAPFPEEEKLYQETTARAATALVCFLAEGPQAAQNKFHGKAK